MVMWWVLFHEVTPHVLASWFPINKKVFLFYPVFHPIKSHIHCLCPFLSNCSCYDAFGRVFFCFDLGWWFGKNYFMECDAEEYICFPIVEQSPKF